MKRFGAYIIGDEILSGKRQDKHLSFVIQTLKQRGLQLSWAQYLADDPVSLVRNFQQSFAQQDVVFCFGGIGATPDDHTRQAAAQALNLEIQRHPQAVAEIEAQYGEAAYPKRVIMAEFPVGSEIIPNPINRVAGFSLQQHYFMPGFPEMAHPMTEWVLQQYYADLFQQQPISERAILVMDAGESTLLDMMNEFVIRYPQLKLFSLPKLDQRRTIELGMKGELSDVEQAMQEICQRISQMGFEWQSITNID